MRPEFFEAVLAGALLTGWSHLRKREASRPSLVKSTAIGEPVFFRVIAPRGEATAGSVSDGYGYGRFLSAEPVLFVGQRTPRIFHALVAEIGVVIGGALGETLA